MGDPSSSSTAYIEALDCLTDDSRCTAAGLAALAVLERGVLVDEAGAATGWRADAADAEEGGVLTPARLTEFCSVDEAEAGAFALDRTLLREDELEIGRGGLAAALVGWGLPAWSVRGAGTAFRVDMF